jgi:hypothetical protein
MIKLKNNISLKKKRKIKKTRANLLNLVKDLKLIIH